MARMFLGVDVGTSGTKALLLADSGAVKATATVEHPIHFPRPGWSEQDPVDWWTSVCGAIQAVLRKTKAKKQDVGAVGLSGQMHGSVFLDAKGRVLCNALLWNDQRTSRECEEIENRAGGNEELIRMVRNVALTGFTAPKILWLRNNKPALFKRLRTVLLPKDYINYRLTGVLQSEVSDASGTLLLDVEKRRWSHELLELLELDPALLPPLAESCEVIGALTGEAAQATGLKAGTPVVAGAGDQPAAAVGTGVARSGIVSATIGTSGVVFAHSDTPVPNDAGLLQSFCHAVPGKWCVFGCMLSAGGSLQWAREVLYADRLKAVKTERDRDKLYMDMIKEAAAADGAAPVLFHPFLTGERCPYPHPYARGALIGLTRAHARGALVRGVLEGITMVMGQQIALMERLGVPIREVRLAGGGARNAWWRQLQADVYGHPCATMASEEGSALGAALLAAVGAGAFRDVPAACRAAARVKETLKPVPKRTKHYRMLTDRLDSTYDLLEPVYWMEAYA